MPHSLEPLKKGYLFLPKVKKANNRTNANIKIHFGLYHEISFSYGLAIIIPQETESSFNSFKERDHEYNNEIHEFSVQILLKIRKHTC